MNDGTRRQAQARLKRIEGQVGGILRMVEEGRHGPDVLLQLSATQAALAEVVRLILAGQIEHSLSEALRSRSPRSRRKRIDELTGILSRFYGPRDKAGASEPAAALDAGGSHP